MDISNRHKPVDKKVVYVNFRFLLSSFDHFFHWYHTYDIKGKKQDYLRKQSETLYQKIKNGDDDVKKFTDEDLQYINHILGKDYKSGYIVSHNLFGNVQGDSVYFDLDEIKYSEAQAGSGETIVSLFIFRLLRSDKTSLILLDEPEISLHPGAQERLLETLLDQILKKDFQIVVSTHSKNFLEELPRCAIKVFQKRERKFSIIQNLPIDSAFIEIEEKLKTNIKIRVEDQRAQEVVNSVIEDMGSPYDIISVEFEKGGADEIWKDINLYCREDFGKSVFLLFDGDQKIDKEELNKYSEISDMKKLLQHVYPTVDTSSEKKGFYKKYVLENVFFLPKNTPEDIIYNSSNAEKFSDLYGVNFTDNEKTDLQKKSGKEKLKFIVSKIRKKKSDTSMKTSYFDCIYNFLIQSWHLDKNEDWQTIKDLIKKIYNDGIPK